MTTSKQALIAQAMRERLPRYQPGQKLPGVASLCDEFKVSTATAVGAMGVLIAEGLVESRQGAGGGYFRSSRRRQNRAASLRAMVAQLEEATYIVQTAAEHIEADTDLLRETSEPVSLLALIEDALDRVMGGYTTRASELPLDIEEVDTKVSITPVEVTGIRFEGLCPQILADTQAEWEVHSRDALDEDVVGLDLETNATVTVGRPLKVSVTVSQFELLGCRVDLGEVEGVDFAPALN